MKKSALILASLFVVACGGAQAQKAPLLAKTALLSTTTPGSVSELGQEKLLESLLLDSQALAAFQESVRHVRDERKIRVTKTPV